MAELPFMMMNWSRFFSDSKVDALSPEAQGIYALLLGKMWLSGGWLSAKDRVVANKLGLDIRRWRHHYKPLLEPLLRREIDPHVGDIYTQKHLTEVRIAALDLKKKREAATAAARAAKAAKARRKPSVAEPKSAPVSEAATAPIAEPKSASKPQPQKEEVLPLKKESTSSQPTRQGELASSGAVAPLVAGSLPAPSPALLRSKIVKGNGHGKSAEPNADTERDRDHQEPLPEPARAERAEQGAVGLFGALEAAIRAAKPDDDE